MKEKNGKKKEVIKPEELAEERNRREGSVHNFRKDFHKKGRVNLQKHPTHVAS